MEIKRKLDTTNATYDITGLDREQFVTIVSAYRHYLAYTHHCIPEDGLLNKFEKMIGSDTLTV